MLDQRGDTIIEVLLAVTVFSLVAIGAMMVMNQGTNSAQRSLEVTLVKQQIEGGIVHGVAAAIGRPVEFVDGLPAARTIGAWGLPILRDAPEVSVELIDSDEAPGGVTELGVPPAAPAIANAYYSLTGQRVRSLPIQVGAGQAATA